MPSLGFSSSGAVGLTLAAAAAAPGASEVVVMIICLVA